MEYQTTFIVYIAVSAYPYWAAVQDLLPYLNHIQTKSVPSWLLSWTAAAFNLKMVLHALHVFPYSCCGTFKQGDGTPRLFRKQYLLPCRQWFSRFPLPLNKSLDSILSKSGQGHGRSFSSHLWFSLWPFLYHQSVGNSYIDWTFHIHLPQRQVNSPRLGSFGIFHCAPLCAVAPVCPGPLSFISYNFSYRLETNNAFEHTDWGVIAPGSIFCPSGRTIILNDFAQEAFHHPSNCQFVKYLIFF
jgi:hypothetical protein